MRSYGQFCPIARSAEILCERWTMLVVRELLAGSERFNELRRGVPLMSPTLLSKRLHTLEEAGVLESRNGRYSLTRAGRDLAPIVQQFADWGAEHIRDEIRDEELDAALLMWGVRGLVRRDALPEGRTVVEFRFSDAPRTKALWWLLVDEQVDLCLKDPGFEPDLWVLCNVRSLAEVFTNERSIQDALSGGRIRVHGRRDLERSLSEWLRPSPYRLRA